MTNGRIVKWLGKQKTLRVKRNALSWGVIQNVHSLQAWRDILQIIVNAGLISAEASFLKWSLISQETRENWYIAGYWYCWGNYKSIVFFCPSALYKVFVCVFLIVNMYDDSPRKIKYSQDVVFKRHKPNLIASYWQDSWLYCKAVTENAVWVLL